jgi:hypothetical protein
MNRIVALSEMLLRYGHWRLEPVGLAVICRELSSLRALRYGVAATVTR